MKNLKELKTLLCDPLKFFYDVGHKIAAPYTEDPLKERLNHPKYLVQSIKQSLYFFDLGQLSFYGESLSKMARAELLADLEEEDRCIIQQLKMHQLTKDALFSIDILDHIKEPYSRQNVRFIPKTTLTGHIGVVAEKGILVNQKREKNSEFFKALLPPLLLLSTIDTNIPLKMLLFNGEDFSMTKNEASELLDCLLHLYPIALKQPLEPLTNLSDKFGAYSTIAPFFEEIDTPLVTTLNTLVKGLYERF